jgi:hypothetical chaperone protein
LHRGFAFAISRAFATGHPMTRIGIDFGTSNTAAALIDGGQLRLISLEPGHQTIPTAVFLDYAARRTLFGTEAARAMIDGREGRFMRGLKSILGTSLAREKRQFLNERLTLIEITARFLANVRARAEAETGETITAVLSGRPVHFHSNSPERDAQAEADLREAYALAGFTDIAFLPEPEAAALAAGGTGRGLIVDIGGGTSDFTVFDAHAQGCEIHTSHGVRIGGTDFDKALSLAHVMPLLGMGAMLNREFGPGTYPAPTSMYFDLAAWEKIAFVYEPSLLRDVKKMEKLAVNPRQFGRLARVLDLHLGHDIAYAVEAAKIEANEAKAAQINLDVVERGLAPSLLPNDLTISLAAFAHGIGEAARHTLTAAPKGDIDRIVYVGGSSLMSAVRATMERLLPQAKPETAEVFTAVVHGLAIAAAKS